MDTLTPQHPLRYRLASTLNDAGIDHTEVLALVDDLICDLVALGRVDPLSAGYHTVDKAATPVHENGWIIGYTDRVFIYDPRHGNRRFLFHAYDQTGKRLHTPEATAFDTPEAAAHAVLKAAES